MAPAPLIRVAVAAVRDGDRVLIARRDPARHQGGLWEFPGGKIEPGESVTRALARELDEELGIAATGQRPLIRLRHDYPDRRVELDVWLIDGFEGHPHGREGQPVEWRRIEALHPTDFPEANRGIITALRLPDRCLVTPDCPPGGEAEFLARLERSVAAGIRLVQLRCPGLSEPAYRELASAVLAKCRAGGAQLVLNADPGLLGQIPADGIHLTSGGLRAAERRPASESAWVSAACHDQTEVARACHLGVDFLLISPVRATASHPERPPLGWPGFSALVVASNRPVFAMGGVGPADRAEAWRHGAQGVAGIRGFWAAG